MSAVVNFEDVSFAYPNVDRPALNHVSFSIEAGEVVGIIGQNGSGKTTLTRLINGLLHPTSGTVSVAGEATTGRPVQDIAGTVGYVFQNPNHQIFSRTVRVELGYGPRNVGVPEDEIEQRVAEAAEFFRLGDVLDDHPYRCSFPQRKLIGVASIVTMRPSVIIFDEPTTGQDHTTTRLINRLIRDLAEAGTTVLCVSHDMPLLADVSERMLVMRDSRLVADATPSEVFADADLMSSTHLDAPQVTQLSLRTLVPAGEPMALTNAELVAQLVKRGAPVSAEGGPA